MSGPHEVTPAPLPVSAMGADRATTGPIQIAAYQVPPPPPPPAHFGEWWKQLVVICAGMATVGLVAWALGKQFFVTRDEWSQLREVIQASANKTDQAERTFHELKASIEKLQQVTSDMNIKLIQIEAQFRKRRD